MKQKHFVIYESELREGRNCWFDVLEHKPTGITWQGNGYDHDERRQGLLDAIMMKLNTGSLGFEAVLHYENDKEVTA